MQFVGIGYQEMLLVFVLLLVVVGPERMPTVAYQIGRAVRTLQKYARAVRDEFSDEFQYIDEQYHDLKDEFETTSSSLRKEQAQIAQELKASQAEIETNVDSTIREATEAPAVNGNSPASAAAATEAQSEESEPASEETTSESTSSDEKPLVF